MQRIEADRLQKIALHQPVPDDRYRSTIFKVMTGVAGFSQIPQLLLIGAVLWFKDRAITRMPVNQRGVIKAFVLQGIIEEMDWLLQGITQEEMGWWPRVPILKILVDLPAQERAQVAGNAALLITPKTEDLGRYCIVRRIADLLVNERDDATDFVLQAINEEIGWVGRLIILNALMKIPSKERGSVMQAVLECIIPEMDFDERVRVIHDVAALSADQRARYAGRRSWQPPNGRPVRELGISVHVGDRDQRVRAAVQLLRQQQEGIPKVRINLAAQEFSHYLKDRQMNAEHKRLAQHALLRLKNRDIFGPFMDENNCRVLRFAVSGQELIGRLWVFVLKLEEPDRTNAKESMVFALKDSYFMGSEVCSSGKTQRLIVGVLQGRLPRVNVDIELITGVSKAEAAQMFFNVEAYQNIEQLAPLIDAANRFCDENPAVDRADFVHEIEEYARHQGFEEYTEIS